MFFKPTLRTDGVYRGNISGYSEHMNEYYNFHYFAIFNEHGLVAFGQELSDRFEISSSELQDVLKTKDCENFSSFASYIREGSDIKFKFYDFDNKKDYEAGIINPNMFIEWKGQIKKGKVILKCFTSHFNHSLADYTYEQLIPMPIEFIHDIN